MDETFDFVIVGSGAGSMTAALVMRSQGKRVLVLEKTELAGGTTCTSGGVMWIPNTSFMKGEDSSEKALTYLDALADGQDDAPGVTRERRLAFVEEGPKMVDFLTRQGLKFHRIPVYPDYYDSPGSVQTSRTLGADIFDQKQLGDWASKMRPGFLPVPATIEEAFNLPWMKKSKKAKKVMGKIALRMLVSKLTGKKLVSGGAALQGQLIHAALKAGVEIRLNAPVKQILVEGGRVAGVVAEVDGKARRIGATAGVLVNAGGFSRNQAMRDQYLPGTSTEWTATAPGDTGEVLQEAIRIGAAVGQMGETVGQPMALPPGRPPAIAHGEVTKPHSIIVDQSGVRFMSEAQSYVELGRGLTQRRKQSPSAWLVMDSQFLANYMFAGTMAGSAKPQAWFDQGFLKQADSIEGLAQACGVDPATLKATVERFNGFARQGKDEDFKRGERVYDLWLGDPTVTGAAQTLGTIEQGPFYAIQLYPGDVSTFGGLVTDAQARVLKADGSVIPGLYATGTSTASVMGGRSPGAGASIGPAMTFAYIAAKHAAHAENLVEAAA
ncbi:FAD-dependent oxidoreductase [Phenylobacterium sp. LjRoot219]|uniref:FAD-dependent oxidoreductase n=1 Tax=Phenylobacterium sp. LjRoot219 TaxID=3342283 RepID=UPI003ECD5A2C